MVTFIYYNTLVQGLILAALHFSSLCRPDGHPTINQPFNTCRWRLVLLWVDLPALAAVLNMKQFKGEFGCPVCKQRGNLWPSCPMVRDWPQESGCVLGTHPTIVEAVKKGLQGHKMVSYSSTYSNITVELCNGHLSWGLVMCCRYCFLYNYRLWNLLR